MARSFPPLDVELAVVFYQLAMNVGSHLPFAEFIVLMALYVYPMFLKGFGLLPREWCSCLGCHKRLFGITRKSSNCFLYEVRM